MQMRVSVWEIASSVFVRKECLIGGCWRLLFVSNLCVVVAAAVMISYLYMKRSTQKLDQNENKNKKKTKTPTTTTTTTIRELAHNLPINASASLLICTSSYSPWPISHIVSAMMYSRVMFSLRRFANPSAVFTWRIQNYWLNILIANTLTVSMTNL